VKTPKPREWTDRKSGKTYWRVRWNDVNGKEVVKVFGELEEAEDHVKVILTERKRHGRAAAINSDEIDALRIWREFVSKEHTAGRDVPALRDVIRKAIEHQKAGSETPALRDLEKRFLDSQERQGLSHVHRRTLRSRLKRIMSYFDVEEPAGSITTEAVERAMASMRAAELSPQTIKGMRGALHGMFQWALDRDLVKTNPVARAKAPKVVQAEVGTLTPSQLKGLLKTALSSAPRSVPAFAVWAFCGVRRAELCRLRFEDLDHERGELRVSAKVAKTGVARFVPIPKALVAWLEASEKAGVAPLGKIVTGGTEADSEGQLDRWLRDVRSAAGLKEWPQNAMRHSFASHAAALHEDFSKVAAWIGHARDPRLLVSRYRHAVPKGDGVKWFKVMPQNSESKSKRAKKGSRRTA